MKEKLTILAAYTCGACDIQGRDLEVSPGQVLCWNCGRPAAITARVSGEAQLYARPHFELAKRTG
jgi:hypothetical protein